MPIATVQLPNGKIADIEVPQGATPQEIESFVMSQPEFAQQPAAPQSSQAPQQAVQPTQEPQSFQERNQTRAANFAKGIPQGLGNAAIGGVQAATDVGEKAAQLIEKLYFGDNLQMNTFGNRLAEQVKIRKEQQAQLPMSERAGIFVGEVAPTIAAGAGTGARVAAATGSRIAGIATGGGIGGATSSAVSMQEEAGLGNRALETAKGAVVGAGFGTALGVGGKVVGAIGNAGKSLFTAKSAEDILAARLPKEQTTALLEQLKTATPDNPVLLPDIAGDSIKGLTRSVAKISTGRDIVTDALEKRSQGAVSRVADHLSRDISPVDAYFGNLDDLTKARSEASKPLYDKVFGRNTSEAVSNNIPVIKNLNPTGGLFVEYKPSDRMLAPLADNIVTYNKTAGINPDEMITIYRGAPKNQKKIVGGDFITTNLDLAKSYTGDGRVLRKEVKASDILDDLNEPLGDEYIYRPAQKATAKPEAKTTGATLPTKGNEELLSKIAPELSTVRNDFRLSATDAPDNSFALLHHVKESLFDKAQVLKRQGANSQARVYDNLRVELTKKMGEISPDYKKANEIFGGFSQLKGAQEAGLDFSKLRPEEIRREIMSFSVAERDAYRIGVRENLQKTVSSTADGADPAKRIFGNEFKREQLKAVFGNEKKFAEFEQKMGNEIRAADTKAKVLGGSRTDYNMAGDEEFLNKMISGGITAAKSKVNPFYLLEAAHNAVTNKFAGINEKNAGELAKILVNRPDAVNALESIMAKQNSPLQKRVLNEAKQYILTNLATQSSMRGNNDAQAASTENMTEEQIRAQLIQRQQQEPVLMSGTNLEAETQKIKNRYYR